MHANRIHGPALLLWALVALVAIVPQASADVDSLVLEPSSVFGTDPSVGTATLDGPSFGRPRTVMLTSSHPTVASVPASVQTGQRNNVATFTITTHPISTPTNVTITATEGGVSRQAVLTVRPPILTTLSINPDPLRGGDNAIATITVNRPAPTNWLCSIAGPFPPIFFTSGSIVTFLPGAVSTTKMVNSQALASEVNALITVRPPTGQSPSVSTILTVVPTRVATLTLAPASVTGGDVSLGCVTLNGDAAGTMAVVSLSTSNPTLVGVPPSIQIPIGDNDGCFLVQSQDIGACEAVTISATLGGTTVEAELHVGRAEQVTDNTREDRWNARHPSTSGGRVLWSDGNDVFLFDGQSTQVIQERGDLEAVSFDVIGMGTGPSKGELAAVWRRGTDFAWLWRSGQVPALVSAINPIDPKEILNPQAIAIADGHVFVIMQAFFNGNAVKHVFRVDPETNLAENLTGNSPVPGASRVVTSDGQAAWVFVDSEGSKLQFFDGVDVLNIDSGEITETRVRINRGRVVYEKLEKGVQHVWLYDSTVENPAPVRLSAETDLNFGNFAPVTDGYHVAWLSGGADGSNVDVVLWGGLVLNNPSMRPANVSGFVEHPFQNNRGQMLWRMGDGALAFAAAGQYKPLCLTPVAAFQSPWLADGYVAGYGTQAGTNQLDNEVFLEFGAVPESDIPRPPFLVRASSRRDSVILEWDRILGADEYGVYAAEEPGVTRSNHSVLEGGRAIHRIRSNSVRICDVAAGVPHYFVVTAVEKLIEGGESEEVEAESNSDWLASLDEVHRALSCFAGPEQNGAVIGCSAFNFAAADFDCDGDADLADYSILSNQLSP